MDAIFTRRSIRKFSDEGIDQEAVDSLLRAAMAAPSAGNQQAWHFIVVRDKTTLEAVTGFHPYAKMLPEAALGIVVCGDRSLEKHEGYWVQDCSAASQNILLRATTLGLGSVWLGLYPREDRVEGARELFGIPNSVIPLSIIAIGHAAEEKEAVDRYRADRVHQERW